MTKTSEDRGKTPTMLGLVLCLGALPLLAGLIGCSTARPVADADFPSSTESFSLVRPAGPEGPSGSAGLASPVGAAGGGSLAGRLLHIIAGSVTACLTYWRGPSLVGRTRDGVTDAPGGPGETGPQGPAGATNALDPAEGVTIWALSW